MSISDDFAWLAREYDDLARTAEKPEHRKTFERFAAECREAAERYRSTPPRPEPTEIPSYRRA